MTRTIFGVYLAGVAGGAGLAGVGVPYDGLLGLVAGLVGLGLILSTIKRRSPGGAR